MRGFLSVFGPLLFLILIFRLLLHGPSRARTRDAVRRGADRVNFWGWPQRDRSVSSGAILVVLASVTLADVVYDAAQGDPSGGVVVSAAFLGAIVAIGFAVSPVWTKAGMGVIALVTIVVERLGGRGCAAAATLFQNTLWFGSALLLIAAVMFLSLVFAWTRFVPNLGVHDERPIGSRLIVCAGVLRLTDLFLRPEGLAVLGETLSSTPWLLGTMVACLAVVIVGMAGLPHFTASVTGVGVGIGQVALKLTRDPPCRDLSTLFAVGMAFLLIWLSARRFSH